LRPILGTTRIFLELDLSVAALRRRHG